MKETIFFVVMRSNFARRSWVAYYFLKACVYYRVSPFKYFYVHLEHLDPIAQIYSKQTINEKIPTQWKLKSILLSQENDIQDWKKTIEKQFHYPLFLKPEWGENSAGVFRIQDTKTLSNVLEKIKKTRQNYVCQESASGNHEYDFFFIHSHENKKSFPDIFSCIRMEHASLVGDGKTTLQELFQQQSPTLSPNTSFIADYKPQDVLPRNKKLQISFINGVHHGTRYISETKNLQDKEKSQIWKHLRQLGAFEFARVGISAHSLEDIAKGHFKIIEINLFTPFPLDILDPKHTAIQQKKLLEKYIDTLVKTVKRKQDIPPFSFPKALKVVWKKKQMLLLQKHV